MKALDQRISRVEDQQARAGEAFTQLLVELKVLQTRVSFYAAVVSVAVSAAFKFLM